MVTVRDPGEVVGGEPVPEHRDEVEREDGEHILVGTVGGRRAAVTAACGPVVGIVAEPAVDPLDESVGIAGSVFGQEGLLQTGDEPVDPFEPAYGNGVRIVEYYSERGRTRGGTVDPQGERQCRHACGTGFGTALSVLVRYDSAGERLALDYHGLPHPCQS